MEDRSTDRDNGLKRRDFLKEAVIGGTALAVGSNLINTQTASAQEKRFGMAQWGTSVTGTINKTPLVGKGQGTVALESGRFSHVLRMTQIPDNFNPYATGCLIAFVPSLYGALPKQGSLNLKAVTPGEFKTDINITQEDDLGNRIGDLRFTHGVQTKEDRGSAKMTIDGTYIGPTDLVYPGSLDFVLSQPEPEKGLIRGKANQTVFTSKLGAIFLTHEIEISYDRGKKLPFAQVLRVRFTSVNFQKGAKGKGGIVAVKGTSIIERLLPRG